MGHIICKIQNEIIDFQNWSAAFDEYGHESGCGAITWFVGNVRKKNMAHDGVYHNVQGITYESYEVLAEKILNEICQVTQKEFGQDLNLLIVHRVGHLHVGETSIIIGVSSLHRVAAFKANCFIIEEIKKKVPIWKLEHYLSGQSRWLKGQNLNEI